MPSKEIYPNPIVKQVACEVRFPNLFFLENKVGDFQIRIMKSFPESALLMRRQFFIADGETSKIQELIAGEVKNEPVQRIWQFTANAGQSEIQLAENSLVLLSKQHKTYDLEGDVKFRDLLKLVLESFLAVTGIPVFGLCVGLRYIDEFPLPAATTNELKRYINSSLPIERFPVESASALDAIAAIVKGDKKFRHAEALRVTDAKATVTLDYDASAEQVNAEKVMEVADSLHEMISDEFHGMAAEGLLQHMRRKQ